MILETSFVLLSDISATPAILNRSCNHTIIIRLTDNYKFHHNLNYYRQVMQ